MSSLYAIITNFLIDSRRAPNKLRIQINAPAFNQENTVYARETMKYGFPCFIRRDKTTCLFSANQSTSIIQYVL